MQTYQKQYGGRFVRHLVYHQALEVVVTRGSHYRALTVKILVNILDRWSLVRGIDLREVVARGGSTVYVFLHVKNSTSNNQRLQVWVKTIGS